MNENELLNTLNDNLSEYKSLNQKQYTNLLRWMVSLSRYVLQENDNQKHYTSFKRGNIVRVDFGFNVGHELGGMHYAIVLDTKNSSKDGLVTVLPLTSKKNDKMFHTKIDLGTEFYDLMTQKTNNITKELLIMQNELHNTKLEIDSFLENESPEIAIGIDSFRSNYPNVYKWYSQFARKNNSAVFDFDSTYSDFEKLTKKYIKLNVKLISELASMKEGTIVNVNQIRTISKTRIYNPKHKFDTLYNLRLSEASLDKINDKLKQLFVFDKR